MTKLLIQRKEAYLTGHHATSQQDCCVLTAFSKRVEQHNSENMVSGVASENERVSIWCAARATPQSFSKSYIFNRISCLVSRRSILPVVDTSIPHTATLRAAPFAPKSRINMRFLSIGRSMPVCSTACYATSPT